jgi:hypothetical protein
MKKPGRYPRIGPSDISEATLSDDVLAAIGRIILACSDIDDLLASAIFKAAEIHYVPGSMLLGRSEISSKLEKLQRVMEVNAPQNFMTAFATLRVRLIMFQG